MKIIFHLFRFIPSWFCLVSALTKLMPRKGQLALMDFLDCACEEHDN